MEPQKTRSLPVSTHLALAYSNSLPLHHGSPPSLIFTDCSSSDGFECRDQGQNEAANRIARDVHSMLDTFNETTAVWDLEKFFMKPNAMVSSEPVAALRSLVASPARKPTSTWAAVAATDIPSNNRLVKFRPSDGLKRTITEEDPAGQEQDLRTIWIYGWTKDKPLSIVTERASTGAIFSMVHVDQYKAVCVIFQHANSAMLFFDEDAYLRQMTGAGLFGKHCHMELGVPYPESEDLRRMQPPYNERRRLTFARQQLFANGMNEQRFRKDLVDLVGVHNVELVWLFNTGNATVVFSASTIARTVRDEFMRRAQHPGPYADVIVGFSHDPCERPLNLVTQIPCGGPRERSDSNKSGRSDGGKPNGQARVLINPSAAKFVPGAGRVKKLEGDGWQTVGKKR